jgi:addiction module HigA family antidote
LRNPHPGEILKEEFLNEIGMSQNQLGHAIGVPPNRIHAIVNGTRDITADTDLRLCKFFGLSEGYFLRLQNAYDTLEAKRLIAGGQDQALQGAGGARRPARGSRLSEKGRISFRPRRWRSGRRPLPV